MRSLSYALLAIVFAATPVRAAETITLAWDANTESDLAGYIVEYGTSTSPFTSRVDVGYQTTWTLTGTASATTYIFHVLAYNTEGIESAPSNDVTYTTGGCATPDPFVAMGGGTCYNGGWLPPGETPPTRTPPPPPSPAPTTSGGCTTPDPFAAMGGGTCYNGGWLPPGDAPPTSTPPPTTPPPTTPPPSTPPPVTSPGGCSTPNPFASMGGGICYNGGWLPPGETPPTSTPPPATTPPPTTPPPTTTPPVTSSGGCTTPNPFVAMGGGVCYNGGWLPPGINPPSGGTTPPPPPPTSTPPPPTTQSGCATPNPFAGMPGLIGACYNGGWYPVQAQTGTIQSINGSWMIVGDNGTTYLPTAALPVSLQQNGLAVVFAGVPLGMQNSVTLMSVATIAAR